MIKIYLLLLIIILLCIMVFKKEHFQEEDCPTGEEQSILTPIILNGGSVYRDKTIDIDIHWNHPNGLTKNKEDLKQYIIIKNITKDFDYINELENLELDKDDKYSYTIKGGTVISIGELYAITVNIYDVKTSTMISSNALRVKPQAPIDNSEDLAQEVKVNSYSEQLLEALKNKTFDIYL